MEIEIVYWIFKYLKCGNAMENPFVDYVSYSMLCIREWMEYYALASGKE